MPDIHAEYSPSASPIWMVCHGMPPRAKKLKGSGEHTEYTASGTVIHAIAEKWLSGGKPTVMDQRWGDYADVGSFNDELVTSEMFQQVDDYMRHVNELIRPDDVIGIEERLELNHKLFGTADLVLMSDERLVICDLKTGSGVMVNPENNLQLLTYASMALMTMKVKPKEIWLTIVQPPDEIQMKTWVTDVQTVQLHAREVLVAMESDHMEAGTHCRWCSCRASCEVLHQMATNAQALNLDGLTPEGWADALHMAETLKPWSESVFARANQLVSEEGLVIPGYKMVQKMGRKTWKSEKEASFELSEVLPLEAPEIFNDAKLRTPTQLKKELKEFIDPAEIEAMTSVPERGTLIVRDSDKRDAIETGANLVRVSEQIALFS